MELKVALGVPLRIRAADAERAAGAPLALRRRLLLGTAHCTVPAPSRTLAFSARWRRTHAGRKTEMPKRLFTTWHGAGETHAVVNLKFNKV